MTRPIVRRTAAARAAGGCAAAVGLPPARPAMAHGAPVQPNSRTAACAADSDDAGTRACEAARAANGQSFGSFDNLRVPGVDGNDRQTIPDGKLCSGGLPDFTGLDLPRDDYPATRLTAGGTLTVVYRATIPHAGSFRVYLTKPGYDPTEPLRRDDLGSTPILTADNPPLTDGAYRFSGKLPRDRTGRHLLYMLYEIHVDADADGDGRPDLTYQFRFRTELRNDNTFLYNTGPIESPDSENWNRRQFFSVTRVDARGTAKVLAAKLPCPPCNVGPLSIPDYGKLAADAVHQLKTGETVFAGLARPVRGVPVTQPQGRAADRSYSSTRWPLPMTTTPESETV